MLISEFTEFKKDTYLNTVSISLGGQTAEMLLYTTLALNFKSIQGSFCVFSIGGDRPVDRF